MRLLRWSRRWWRAGGGGGARGLTRRSACSCRSQEFGDSPYADPKYENALWPGWAQGKTPETMERARQFELIHARWAMMGCAGAWGAERTSGIPWFQAGKVCTPADCTAVNTIFPGQVLGLAPEGSGFPNYWNVLAI